MKKLILIAAIFVATGTAEAQRCPVQKPASFSSDTNNDTNVPITSKPRQLDWRVGIISIVGAIAVLYWGRNFWKEVKPANDGNEFNDYPNNRP